VINVIVLQCLFTFILILSSEPPAEVEVLKLVKSLLGAMCIDAKNGGKATILEGSKPAGE